MTASTGNCSQQTRDYGSAVLRTYQAGLFAGQTVLVSGGCSGIGRAIVEGFLASGAEVIATGVMASEIEAAGSDPVLQRAKCVQLDVRDDEQVKALVGSLERLDVLVNCAGVIRRNAELEPEVFAEVVDINLNGSMRLCAAARPLLARQGGSIINTASMLSFFGGGLVPGYSASKGGIAQLSKSLAIAYASDDIRVNAIAPGWIETPLTNALQNDPVRYGAISERTAAKRWGKPEDLAGAVLFLASPVAAYITGIVLPVDGGYLVT